MLSDPYANRRSLVARLLGRPLDLETNGNGRNRGTVKLLKLKAGDLDRTGGVQLAKMDLLISK